MFRGTLALVALSCAFMVPTESATATTPVDCPPFAQAAVTINPPTEVGSPTYEIKAPSATGLAAPSGPLAKQARRGLNRNLFYTLSTWIPRCFGDQAATSPIDPRGNAERNIRPLAMAAHGLAIALKTSAYDAAITGVSHADALATTKRIVVGLASTHKANSNATDAWGHHWQSSMWTYYVGLAGWLLHDDLTPAERQQVARMVADEASYIQSIWSDRGVGFMYTSTGKLLYPGNSQAEEDAWNSMAPTLASMMLPNSPEASKWRKVGMSYALGSYTRRSDLGRKVLIDGGRIGATAKGYNLNSNGTMVNHGRVHPEYMSLITMKTSELLTAAVGGDSASQSSLYNLIFMYRTFTNTKLSNGVPAYRPGSYKINYPQGNDWGKQRISCYALLDVYARHLTNSTLGSTATTFMQRHMSRQEALMNRFSDGRTYKGTWSMTGSEYRYVGREQITTTDLGEIWMVEYLAANGLLRAGSNGLLS